MKYTRFCFQEKSKLRLLFWIHSLQNIFRLPGLFLWQEKYPSHDIMESWQRWETFYFKTGAFYITMLLQVDWHSIYFLASLLKLHILQWHVSRANVSQLRIGNDHNIELFLWSLSCVFLSRHHPDQMSQVSRFKSYSRQTQTPDIWHLWTLTFVTPC